MEFYERTFDFKTEFAPLNQEGSVLSLGTHNNNMLNSIDAKPCRNQRDRLKSKGIYKTVTYVIFEVETS